MDRGIGFEEVSDACREGRFQKEVCPISLSEGESAMFGIARMSGNPPGRFVDVEGAGALAEMAIHVMKSGGHGEKMTSTVEMAIMNR